MWLNDATVARAPQPNLEQLPVSQDIRPSPGIVLVKIQHVQLHMSDDPSLEPTQGQEVGLVLDDTTILVAQAGRHLRLEEGKGQLPIGEEQHLGGEPRHQEVGILNLEIHRSYLTKNEMSVWQKEGVSGVIRQGTSVEIAPTHKPSMLGQLPTLKGQT
jgi:hypothetical protein